WRYERNAAVLHTDTRVMPPEKRMWASWNYRDEAGPQRGKALEIAYHLNRLQGVCDAQRDYFLTLNPSRPIAEECVLGRYSFTHPVSSAQALAGRGQLTTGNGTAGVWFCGSSLGYGFHEDAVRSGVEVAGRLGCEP